uniref:DUF6396 domain-containing protein n=1 Tax=Ralstonia syzygii R24 TaxID=907261 RepID=G3ABD0_9RALS|nr:hypothetical protein RALSY_mp30131 [Ralstonia syzygii R24]
MSIREMIRSGALQAEDGRSHTMVIVNSADVLAEVDQLRYIGVSKDAERSRRYKLIGKFIDDNDGRNAKLSGIDRIVPQPPAKLPPWDGTFQWEKDRAAAAPSQKPSDEPIERLRKAKRLDPAAVRLAEFDAITDLLLNQAEAL